MSMDSTTRRIVRRLIDILSNAENVTDMRIVIQFDIDNNPTISYSIDENIDTDDLNCQDEEDD